MKTTLIILYIFAMVAIAGATAVMAGPNEASVNVFPEYGSSSEPVSCLKANAVRPVEIVANNSPCPGKVYCNNPNSNCGEYCCEWGYFYSNSCDCKCYKSSYDAGAKCSSYFRCN